MISVTLFATAALRSKSKRRSFELPFHEGMTARDVILGEFKKSDMKSIMVMVNGAHEREGIELNDGDNVGLMLVIGGG